MAHANICLSLRSDKVTWRARGKQALKESVVQDRVRVIFSNYQWWEITNALLEYETKELSYARSKNRGCNHDNAVFFSTYMRQSLQYALLSTKKVVRVVKHILNILHDRSLEESYHREYLNCLCDLLETLKINRYIQGPGILADLFNYLRHSYNPTAPTPILLRLLKGLCRVIFSDTAIESGILVELLEWLASTLAIVREELPPSSSIVVSVVNAHCSCFTSILTLHGRNYLSDVFYYVDCLLDAVIQQLSLQSVANRDYMLQFLLQFYQLSAGTLYFDLKIRGLGDVKRNCREVGTFSAHCLPSRNPMTIRPVLPRASTTPILVMLYDTFAVFDGSGYLAALMHYMRGAGSGGFSSGGGGGSNKGSTLGSAQDVTFFNYMEDVRFSLNIQVVAWTMCLLQSQVNSLMSQSNSDSLDAVKSNHSSTQSGSEFCGVQKQSPVTDHYMSMLSLLGCLNGGICTQQEQVTQTQASTQRSQVVSDTIHSRSERSGKSMVLLECKVYILAALCRIDMSNGAAMLYLSTDISSGIVPDQNIEVFPSNEHETKLSNITKWVLLMRRIVVKVAGGGRGLLARDGQLIGASLFALNVLLELSRNLLTHKDNHSTCAVGNALRKHWAETLSLLVESTCSSSSTSSLGQLLLVSCRRQSVAAVLMALFTSALSPPCSHINTIGDCLLQPSTWHDLQQKVWQVVVPLFVAYDPRQIDCPQFFNLLAALQKVTFKSSLNNKQHSALEQIQRLDQSFNITLLSKAFLMYVEQNVSDSVIYVLYTQWLHASCNETHQPSSCKVSLQESEGFLFVIAWLDNFFSSQHSTGGRGGGGGGSGGSRIYVLQHLDAYISALSSATRAGYSRNNDIFFSDGGSIATTCFPSQDGITASGRVDLVEKSLSKRLNSYTYIDSWSKSIEDPIQGSTSPTTIPTASFSFDDVHDFLRQSTAILDLSGLLFTRIRTNSEELIENTNEFLSQRQLTVLFLSVIYLTVMQQVPDREVLQLTYTSANKREEAKLLLHKLRNVIHISFALFWSSQKFCFRYLTAKPYLFRGNGNTGILGCSTYHTKCMQLCSLALIESQRLRLILQDMSSIGIDSICPALKKGNDCRKEDPVQHEILSAEEVAECAGEMLRYLRLIIREASATSGVDAQGASLKSLASTNPNPSQRGEKSKSRATYQKGGRSPASLSFNDNEEDDDFMEKSSVKSSQQTSSVRSSSQIEEFPDEPDLIDGAFRLTFTRDQVQMVSSTASCFLGASMANLSEQEREGEFLPITVVCTAAIEKLMLALTSSLDETNTLKNGETYAYKLPSEVALTLAEHMTFLAYPSTAIHAFLVQNTWTEDWGVLGYHRVLSVIRELTTHPDYFVPFLRSSSVDVRQEYGQIFNLVFCASLDRDDSVEVDEVSDYDDDDDDNEEDMVRVEQSVISQLPSFLQEHWGNRVLQLECGANIFNAAPQMYKKEFGDIILKGLVDTDKRVNQATVAHLPLLFKHLPNHHKKYLAVRGFMNLDETFREAVFDYNCQVMISRSNELDDVQNRLQARKVKRFERFQEEVASKMCAVAACGQSSPTLVGCCLKDLCVLYAAVNPEFSDADFSAPSSPNEREYLSNKAKDIDYTTSIPLKCLQQVNFGAVVESLLMSVASKHGYPTVCLLIRDHLQWLLAQWMTVQSLTVELFNDELGQEEDQVLKLYLPLRAFPYHFLGYDSLQSFLLKESDLLLPTICLIKPSQYRWSQLLSYTHDAGFVEGGYSEDQAVAAAIRQNVSAIRGAQLCLSDFYYSVMNFVAEVTHTSLRPSSLDDEAEYMTHMISRVTNVEDIRKYLQSHRGKIGQIVEYILCVGCVWWKLTDIPLTDETSRLGYWDSLIHQSRKRQSQADVQGKPPSSMLMLCYARFDKSLSAVLDKTVVMFEKKNKTELLVSVDLLSILARLKLLLHTSQSEYKKTCYAFCINFLSKYVSSKFFLETMALTSVRSTPASTGDVKNQYTVELYTRSIIHALTDTVEKVPLLLEVVVHSFKRIADNIAAMVTLSNVTQSNVESRRQLVLAQQLANCLPDVFAEVVCILCALNAALVKAFILCTRTPPGAIVAPSESHRSALEAASILDECYPSDSFVAAKYSAFMEFTKQQAMDLSDASLDIATCSQYVGHSRSSVISSFDCKSLRRVLIVLLSCGDTLRVDQSLSRLGMAAFPAVLTPLTRETSRLLFLDWECLQDQYMDMGMGDVDSCSLIEELQGRVEAIVDSPRRRFNISCSRNTLLKMLSLVRSIWEFLQGSLVSKSLLWLKLVNLREHLQPCDNKLRVDEVYVDVDADDADADDADADDDLTDMVGDRIEKEDHISGSMDCITAILSLGQVVYSRGGCRSANEMLCFQHDITYIMGSLGFQDYHSVPHNSSILSARIRAVEKTLNLDSKHQSSNIHSQLLHHPIFLKVDLITSKLLFHLHEGNNEVTQESLCALRNLQVTGALVDLQGSCDVAFPSSCSPRGLALKSIAASSSSVRCALAVLSSVAAPAESTLHAKYIFCGHDGSGRGWDHDTWSTVGKTYSSWVTTLTSSMISECYGENASNCGAIRGSSKEGFFMLSLQRMASLNTPVAEGLFPLILLDLLQANPASKDIIADRLKTHIFSEDASIFINSTLVKVPNQTPLEPATRLGCQALVFLLRQSVAEVRPGVSKHSQLSSVKSSKKRPLQVQHVSSEPLDDSDGCPFSIRMPLSFELIAAAAMRCGCVSTAALFMELAGEESFFYWQRDQDESQPTGHVHTSEYLEPLLKRQARGGVASESGYEAPRTTHGGGSNKKFARLSTDLLRDIYQRLHDPDASQGIPPSVNHSLAAQAKQYAHRGQWHEALATYQCMLQLPRSTRSGNAESELGVAESLRALGYHHLLRQNVDINYKVSPNSHSNEVTSPNTGDESWRHLLFSDEFECFDEEHIAGSNAVGAVTNLSQWPDYLETDSIDHYPVVNGSGSKIPGDYFNSALYASLQGIRNGQHVRVMKRLRECTSQLIPALLDEGHKEARRGLMWQLVRLQQIVEIEEVASSISYADYKGLTRFPTQQGLCSKLISSWRERLNSGSALNDYVCCEKLLSLRLGLLACPVLSVTASSERVNSSHNRICKSQQLTPFLHQVLDLAERADCDQETGTLLACPLLHQVKFLLFGALATRQNEDHTFIKAKFTLFESRLMWRKRLHEVAITMLQDHVIEPLTELLAADVNSIGKSDLFVSVNSQRNSLRNILSEAYRSTGEWMAARRSHSGDTILQRYLNPAVVLAESRQQKVKTHLTLAQYHLHMYRTVHARVASLEWKQGKILGEERKNEYEKSRVEYQKMLEDYHALCSSSSSTTKANKQKPPPRVSQPKTEEQAAMYHKLQLVNRHVNVLKRESAIDAREREDVEQSVEKHLVQALDHFRTVLVLSPSASVDTVFHVIHLWFDSGHLEQVNAIIKDIIHRAPSFHFVSLHYQIMSRLDGFAREDLLQSSGTSLQQNNSGTQGQCSRTHERFQNTLTEMLFKLGKEHPYHVLPQLFALMHDKLAWENISTYENEISCYNYIGDKQSGVGRIMAARSILHSVKHHFHLQAQESANIISNPYTHLVEGMETLFVQYVKLALTNMTKYIDAKKTKGLRFSDLVNRRGEMTFHECLNGRMMQVPGRPAQEASSGTKKASKRGSSAKETNTVMTLNTADFHLAVITKHHKVLSDGRYTTSQQAVSSDVSSFECSGITYVHGFLPTFSLTDDGLSRPKIIKCLGSDGRTYTQLVKGGDDTRQDSVMQQVFEHVNTMLSNDQACLKRNINIRTYKIVPTTPQSGIIEWVENTIPFGSYLCERPGSQTLGAHTRYHPEDLKPSECRALMHEVIDKSAEEKEKTFLAICRQFRPAFRYFFLESFADPSDWMQARLAYTRGVAATSMVGYILGIGDRHAHNILVDITTAEVVHIDFGIMFEQGKVIGTPETVPFRLTRDVVDGMGITGVEGTFRKCCEEVLRVLRLNYSQLLTILEVVIHDPLYKWSLSPVQVQARRRHQQHLGDMNDVHLSNYGGLEQPTSDQLNGSHGVGGTSSQDAAQRALSRIQNKLQGYEDPSGQSMSTVGQVQHVINEARDPKNLCKIFKGWSAWL